MKDEIEQGLHEKLCAYVLGESDGAERAEVERELLRSPELRAERERLEATIGTVRSALAREESLSPEAKQALERVVRPAPMANVPWLRLAAGIGAVGLGWWIFARGPEVAREVQVADLERPVEARGAAPAGGPREELALLERVSSDSPSPTSSKQDAFTSSAEVRGLDSLSREKTGLAPEKAGASVGYSAATSTPETRGAVAAGDPHELPAERRSNLEAGRTTEAARARTGPTDPGGVAAPRSAARTELGLGQVSGGGGAYRGPGDSAPPAAPAIAAERPALWTRVPSAADEKHKGPKLLLADGGAERAGQEGANADRDERNVLRDLGYAAGDDGQAASAVGRARPWHELAPEERARHLEFRCDTILRGCLPLPNERPRDMFFRFWGDNPFEVTLLDKLSTFSVDVDTASYALARRYLLEGQVPEKAQVRTEEFVNYFRADVEAPRRATFSVHTDLTPSRFSADAARRMLRVVVRAKDVEKSERDPLRLTFVVDVSGSMREQNRIETVKSALRMLVAQLEPRDSIAIVKFSNDASLVLPMTPVVDRAAIEAAIAPLAPGGSTNSNAGLQLGYAQALTGLGVGAVNRVVFLSDGVANVGETDAAKILEGVKGIREKGIYLNTIGVGMNNHNDVLLEQLANLGDGICNYVDGPKEVQRALVDRFTGAFQPIARDVKIQVEFDPAQVLRYRLLGYENRAIADADFRNDAVDAGEIGAGHQVTALYEIEVAGPAGDGPLATVRLRWKPILPAGQAVVQVATEAAFDVHARSYQAYESSPVGHRRALVVAQFAEILRRSIHARGDSLDDLIREVTLLQTQVPGDTEFAEFAALVVRAKDLILRAMPACDEMCQTVDALRANAYLGSVFSETGRDPATLAEIEKTRRDLEQRLRELVRVEAEAGR